MLQGKLALTNQTQVVTHQHGISVLVLFLRHDHFQSCGIMKCQQFSQTSGKGNPSPPLPALFSEQRP